MSAVFDAEHILFAEVWHPQGFAACRLDDE